MSVNTTNHTASFAGAFETIGNIFSRLGKALIVNRSMDARMARMNALQSKTDEELNEMGLRRDQIVSYVFRDLFYA